ncbi:LemA family protein [Pleurocapsa sp. PCC 7319]|uniref:LemA family protein n=1 Tax=Pleurocapsa sp. PCC 7319 TaxID=118161 RepID=UPI00034A6972|nr:LemA family protein [Pleurocapsa sp. PCC 7319]
MQNNHEQIPEEIAAEVLDLASHLYAAESSGGYSLEELQEAGKEVSIPPELIQKALKQIRTKQQQAKQKRQQTLQISLGIGVTISLWGVLVYNSLNQQLQQVNAAWAQVENQLQRKVDLVPQLINLTQAQAQREQQLIQQLTQSRQEYLQANNNSDRIIAIQAVNSAIQDFQEYANINNQLQSSQTFINLQYEITGTANRLATERRRYNQTVQIYNQKVTSFPNSIIAKIIGYKSAQFYQIINN